MAFQRIDLLPRLDPHERFRVRKRWEGDGKRVEDHVTELIRQGGGEDFLQYDFEAGRLGFLEDQWDLKGFSLFNEDIVFPTGDNFESINFAYAQFWHSHFKNACFPQTSFYYSRFYNVKFTDCLFALASFYGAHFEKCQFINCDFVEANGFTNCDLKETSFENCFFNENKFDDCRFDEGVRFFCKAPSYRGLFKYKPDNFHDEMKRERISGILRGIKSGYSSGGVHRRRRQFHFLESQSFTRYNTQSLPTKLHYYLWELLSGYGLRPLRVIYALVISFILSLTLLSHFIGNFHDGIILASGALFTFGAKSELLDKLPILAKLIYIFTAFTGISLIALFITVIVNVYSDDK